MLPDELYSSMLISVSTNAIVSIRSRILGSLGSRAFALRGVNQRRELVFDVVEFVGDPIICVVIVVVVFTAVDVADERGFNIPRSDTFMLELVLLVVVLEGPTNDLLSFPEETILHPHS